MDRHHQHGSARQSSDSTRLRGESSVHMIVDNLREAVLVTIRAENVDGNDSIKNRRVKVACDPPKRDVVRPDEREANLRDSSGADAWRRNNRGQRGLRKICRGLIAEGR